MITKKLSVVSLCLACGVKGAAMKTTVQGVLLSIVVGSVVLLPVTEVFADCDACIPTITQVPDFIVSGDGSCTHGGIGQNGGPPTDTLTIDVPNDPKCHQCTVVVTAVWGPGPADMESSPPKGPGTHAGGYWPHNV